MSKGQILKRWDGLAKEDKRTQINVFMITRDGLRISHNVPDNEWREFREVLDTSLSDNGVVERNGDDVDMMTDEGASVVKLI